MVVSRILLFSTKKPGERIQCDVSHIFFRLGWELGTSTTNFPPRPTLPKMPTFRRSGMVHGAATPMIFRWQRDILNSSNQRVGVEKSCRIPIKGGMSEFIPRFQVSTNHMDFFAALDGCENVRFFFFCDLKRTRGWSKRSRTQKSPEQVNVNVNITKQPFFCGWNFGCLLVTQTLTQIRSTYSVIFHWMMASRANWTIFPSHPKIGTSNQIQPS